MSRSDVFRLENAVLALSEEIEKEVCSSYGRRLEEEDLWYEVICCILSSQVPYSLASAVACKLADGGYIKDIAQRRNCNSGKLSKVLSDPLSVEGKDRRYRFPNEAARRINMTLQNIAGKQRSLSSIVFSGAEPQVLRSELMQCVAGFGPKQASMFLRNVGACWNLAILDRHVLRFMEQISLIKDPSPRALSWPHYVEYERRLKGYSAALGCRVGCVDWAIWIVMRTAGKARA